MPVLGFTFAFRIACVPEQIVALFTLTVGLGFARIEMLAVFEQPLLSIPITEYVVVVFGVTRIVLVLPEGIQV